MENTGERETVIRKDELIKAAEKKKLSPENAEKDYLLDALLYCIYAEFGKTLVLKGGTCLYKLHNLNRFSEDLDFTLNKRRFDAEKFAGKTIKAMKLIDIEGRGDIESFKNETNIRFHFKGPLYSGSRDSLCYVSVNISQRERVLRPEKREMLISAYREIPSFELFVMDEIEIVSEKVRAIMTRNKARDVYDLWFLLKKGIKPDVGLINQKLKKYRMKFEFNNFAGLVDEKKATWDMDLRGLIMGSLPDFGPLRKEILDAFRKL